MSHNVPHRNRILSELDQHTPESNAVPTGMDGGHSDTARVISQNDTANARSGHDHPSSGYLRTPHTKRSSSHPVSTGPTPSHPSLRHWQRRLRERGILNEALEAGWSPSDWKGQPGLAYFLHDEYGQPVYLPDGREARRWRNLKPSTRKGRFLWGYPNGRKGEAKPSGCDSYHLPGINLPQEVRRAHGRLIIACGETDMLTHTASGSRNVTSFLGEKNIPANLVEKLRAWGVQQVDYYPDNDTTGREAVDKLARTLHGSGIALSIFELPMDVDGHSIKDINDLFVAVGFDVERFRAALSDLDELTLDGSDQHGDTGSTLNTTDRPHVTAPTTDRELPEAYYAAIEDALGIKHYLSNGWSAPVACPFKHHEHDSIDPAAGFHREMHIFRCFKCGHTWLSVELGGALGLDWRDFTHRRQPPRPRAHDRRKGTSNGGGSESTSGAGAVSGKSRKPTHDEIGDAQRKLWDGDVAYFYEQWHRYESGWWRQVTDIEIRKDVWKTTRGFKSRGINPSQSLTNSVTDYLRSRSFIGNEQIDGGQHYVNLQNGVFNLETGELEPHQRELYMTSQLDFAYDPDAQAPVWQECLSTWLITQEHEPDEDLIRMLQEAFGYSLTTDTSHQVAFILYGEAASGKSTVINTLRGLLGNAATSLDLATLSHNQYQLADIHGKSAVTCTEAPAGTVLADATFKQLVSGEEMVLRQIRRESFRAVPTAKVWWALNELPRNSDRSNAVYRRMKIISFRNPLPPELWDRQLDKKLTAELPGIFNWAVEGLKRLKQQGAFTEARQVSEAVEAYRAENDIEARFVKERCTTGIDCKVKSSILYEQYVTWCRENGHVPKASNRVSRDWERLGFKNKRRNDGNYYLGVDLCGSQSVPSQ